MVFVTVVVADALLVVDCVGLGQLHDTDGISLRLEGRSIPVICLTASHAPLFITGTAACSCSAAARLCLWRQQENTACCIADATQHAIAVLVLWLHILLDHTGSHCAAPHVCVWIRIFSRLHLASHTSHYCWQHHGQEVPTRAHARSAHFPSRSSSKVFVMQGCQCTTLGVYWGMACNNYDGQLWRVLRARLVKA